MLISGLPSGRRYVGCDDHNRQRRAGEYGVTVQRQKRRNQLKRTGTRRLPQQPGFLSK
jgi:hypothetical protein